jgi:hypothetical protein
MSKKKRSAKEKRSVNGLNPPVQDAGNRGGNENIFAAANSKLDKNATLRRHWLAALVIGFVALGTLGAGLKYLETDAERQSCRA